MTFNSVQYALFLPLVVGVYWLLGHRAQNYLLLVASYFFYGYWDWRFLGLLGISTMTDFIVAQRIDATSSERTRKGWLLLALGIQLGILGFFKYAGFFVDEAGALLTKFGVSADIPVLRILLPVGISFYTFQSMSYTFDVFRRRMQPTKNLADFALFVAFFPVLVAGPIERASHLLPQVQLQRKKPDAQQFRSGITLILFGLFKKVVLADAMGPVADTAFGTHHPGSLTVLFGAYAFAIQIYADFSGYSDIARGSARLMGFELMRNFEQPYLSRNITEFWRRWHISLSSWLRDYLYVPLGGNRSGSFNTYRNLFLTMVLAGLWHGAGIGFVLWGVVHGLLLASHRWINRSRSLNEPMSDIRLRDAPRILLTFHLTTLAWIFFRSSGWSQAAGMFAGLFRLHGSGLPSDAFVLVGLSLAVMVLTDLLQRGYGSFERWTSLPAPVRAAVYAAVIVAVLIWSGGPARPFIYFQF